MGKTARVVIACDDGLGLNGQVSAHFGRCPYYCLADVRDGAVGEVEVRANPFYGQHQPGSAPNFIKTLKADVILAGGMGRRAVEMFESFGIEPVSGVGGNVAAALGGYLRGELVGTQPCNHDHPESCGGHGDGHGRNQLFEGE